MRGYGKSDAPEAIDQYTIFHLVGDLVGLLDALEAPTAVIVGHDWGASIAWQAARLRPDRFRAVVALSVPFRPRGRVRPTSVMPQTADAQFYQLYFQNPGVAEAELERDPRATVRNMLYGASGDGAAARAARGKPWRCSEHRHGAARRWYDARPRGAGDAAGVAQRSRHRFLPPANSSARASAAASIIIANIDRNWELTAAFADVKVNVPALYVAGDRDMVVSFPGTDQLLANLNSSFPHCVTSRCSPAAGHWTQQERPGEVSAAIIDFVRGLPN